MNHHETEHEPRPLAAPRVVMVSYGITEETGGPGRTLVGYAENMSALGASIVVVALDDYPGRWMIDPLSAAEIGVRFVKVPGGLLPVKLRRLTRALRELPDVADRPTVCWVNGIWGAQSLATARVCRERGWPFVVRPIGSLCDAAMQYKTLKKKLYLAAVESRPLRAAVAMHCESDKEVRELPAWLRSKAFVVGSGIDIPDAVHSTASEQGIALGVLARLHPIKRLDASLDVVESLVAAGHDVRLQFAGALEQPDYVETLRARVDSSDVLRARVEFLGHLDEARLRTVVSGWHVALLLSEQENFGHAVITAAAFGVPTLVSPDVGVGVELQRAGAGMVVEPERAAAAVLELRRADPAELRARCRALAERYGWKRIGAELLGRLSELAHGGRAD